MKDGRNGGGRRKAPKVEGLYPTPSRISFLGAVSDGAVAESRSFPYESTECVIGEHGTHRYVRVSARCNEARTAGWIRLEPAESASRWSRKWLLTDLGRSILESAR